MLSNRVRRYGYDLRLLYIKHLLCEVWRKGEQMKLYKKKHSYKAADGTEKKAWNFYVCENNNFVAVKPAYKEDYRVLAILAEELPE